MPGDPRFGQNLEPMLLLEAAPSGRLSVIDRLAVAGIAESDVWSRPGRGEGEPPGVTGFG